MTLTNEQLDQFIIDLTAHMEGFDKGLPYEQVFSYEKGRKYIRIVQGQKWDGVLSDHRSVFMFIDFEGNIYKAAGWKAPAKYIRGHISKLETSVGPYGPAYLK